MEATESNAAFAAARKLFRAGAPDWVFPSYFLPREKRRAVDAVAAFCSMIVEALDLPQHTLGGARAMREHPVVRTSVPLQQLPPENAGDACEGDTIEMRLEMLRERIDEIYDGRLELPAPNSRSPQQHSLLALSVAVKDFPIDRKLFIEFANASRDSDESARAAAMGVMISSILGVSHSDGRRHAILLATGIVNKDQLLMREGAEKICWLADDGSRFAVAIATILAARGNPSGVKKLLALPAAMKLARRMDDQLLPKF